MLIPEYEDIGELKDDSIFLIDGSTGTKKTTAKVMIKQLLSMLTAQEFADYLKFIEMKRSVDVTSEDMLLIGGAKGNIAFPMEGIYELIDALPIPVEARKYILRGKHHGDGLSTEQAKAIKDGTFKNLFIGDTFGYGQSDWRLAIVDIDYFSDIEEPHIACMVMCKTISIYFSLTMVSSGSINANICNDEWFASRAKALGWEPYMINHNVRVSTGADGTGVTAYGNKSLFAESVSASHLFGPGAISMPRAVSAALEKPQLSLFNLLGPSNYKQYKGNFINHGIYIDEGYWLHDVASSNLVYYMDGVEKCIKTAAPVNANILTVRPIMAFKGN